MILKDVEPTTPQRAGEPPLTAPVTMAIAPMLGPMIGGVFDELFGWRSNFMFYAAAGAALLAICWVDAGETNTAPSETMASQIKSYPELFSSRRFWGYAACMAFSTGAFYAFLAGVPLVAGTIFNLSPSSLGFYMGTITSGFMAGSFLSGRYSKRFALTTMVLAGRVVACAGLIVGLVLLLAGFSSSEYTRSWTWYESNREQGFVEFGKLAELAGYYRSRSSVDRVRRAVPLEPLANRGFRD